MPRWIVWMLCMTLTACGTVGNQYHCPPTMAYDATGKPDYDRYSVDRECFKRQDKKITACYGEAED